MRNRRDEPRPPREQLLEAREIERAVPLPYGDAADHHAALLEREPGADIGIVIEIAHDHLIPRRQQAGESAADRVRERGHVRAEHDLRRRPGVDERRHELPRARDQMIGALTRGKRAVAIGISRREIVRHRRLHPGRHLGARGVVEVGHRRTTEREPERRKLLAHPGAVQTDRDARGRGRG